MKIFENFSFRKLLSNKKIAILLSVFVAFFFWLIISIEETPEREREINKVHINVNTDEIFGETNLKVVGDISQTASVKVYGPNYLVSSLTPDDIIVKADLSMIKGANEYEISLFAQPKSGNSGYVIRSISPERITVKLDYYETKTIEASAVIDGYGRLDDDDYIYDSVFTSNNSANLDIKVSGFRTDLNKLSSIEFRASTDEIVTETKVFTEPDIVLLDAEGKELPAENYELSEQSSNIALAVSKEKTISVSPQYVGMWNSSIANALSGCWKTDTKTLTLKGPPDVIDSMTKLEYQNPIDLSKLYSSDGRKKTFELTPKLSNGVSISDATQTIVFEFDLSSLTTKVFKVTAFDHEGTLPNGINVSYKNEYSVKVCGPKNVINRLSADDLYLYIDLSDIKAGDVGTKTIKGQLKSRNNDAVWMIDTCDVSVKIQ